MAQLAIASAGAAIGFALGGGPVGGQFGWAIGSMLGGYLLAPNEYGPRISESQVQYAQYGAPLVRVWGGDVVAGSVIWAGPLVENASEESVGKGGPSVTTFTYTRSFAIAVAEGHVESLRRVWADAKLIYDASARTDMTDEGGTLWATAQAIAAKFIESMNFYQGTESQLADPVIEAIEGAGNVEAYRGVSYIVFEDFALGAFGNRIPNFRFEVSTEAEEAGLGTELEPLVVYDWVRTNVESFRPIHVQLDAVGGYSESCVFTPLDKITTPATFTSFATAADEHASQFAADTGFYESGAASISTVYSGYYYTSRWGSGTDGLKVHIGTNENYETITVFLINEFVSPADPYGRAAANGTRQLCPTPYAVSTFSYEVPQNVDVPRFGRSIGDPWDAEFISWTTVHSGSAAPPIGYASTPYSQDTYGALVITTWVSYALQLEQFRTPTHDLKSGYAGDPNGIILDRWHASRSGWRAELPDNQDWLIDRYGAVSPNYTWEIIGGTAKQLCAIEYLDGELYQQALGPVLLPGDPDYNNSSFWDDAATAAIAAGTMQGDTAYPVTVTSYAEGTPPPSAVVGAGSVLLSEIVSDLCVDAGLTTGQIDVTALTDTVLGFTRPRRMPARACIESLRAAYWFDAVESGEKIVFVKRGGASVATLTTDDMGAGLDAAAEQAVETERGQEGELPGSVTVAYRSRAADYETGTQRAERRVGATDQQGGIEVAVVLSDTRAAQVAEVILYDAWAARTTRKISVTRAWSKLEPTDVITIDDGEASRRVRIVDKTEQSGVITLDCRDDDAAIYSPVGTGAALDPVGASAVARAQTRAVLLDIPLLQETDVGAGYYVASGGYVDEWNGGRLYRSLDGSTYQAVRDLSNSSVTGVCESILGDYLGGNTIDWLNTVDVAVVGGELASVPVSALLDNANACVIGSEIVQFAGAELLSAGRYRLSGLLRGRLGTEQFMSTHDQVENERFVLLAPGTLYRPGIELSYVGRSIEYKAVTFGNSIAGTEAESFTWNAASLKPLSPVHVNIQGSPSGAGYNINWVRRTRIGSAWSDGGDVPLSESSERYRVRVMWGPNVIEETETTAAQAVVGVGQDYTYHSIEICQLSDAVGPGFPATKDF